MKLLLTFLLLSFPAFAEDEPVPAAIKEGVPKINSGFPELSNTPKSNHRISNASANQKPKVPAAARHPAVLQPAEYADEIIDPAK